MELLIKIASVLTALTVITGAIVGVVKTFRKLYAFLRKVEKKMDTFTINLQENTLNTLRLVIINDKMPLSERLKAGQKYIELGGNGEIHAMVEALEEKYKEGVK